MPPNPLKGDGEVAEVAAGGGGSLFDEGAWGREGGGFGLSKTYTERSGKREGNLKIEIGKPGSFGKKGELEEKGGRAGEGGVCSALRSLDPTVDGASGSQLAQVDLLVEIDGQQVLRALSNPPKKPILMSRSSGNGPLSITIFLHS